MWSRTGSSGETGGQAGDAGDAGGTSSSTENEDYGGDGNDYSGIFGHDGPFEEAQQAVDWAKQVAIAAGFCLVVVTHKSQRDGRMDRILRCDRYRKREERDFRTATRFDTKRKGCGCEFRVKVRQLRSRDGWEVVGYSKWGYHNHEMIVYEEGHRQLSGLSPAAKLVVKEMSDAQVKPAKILASVLEKFPEDHPNRRHIYNVRQQLRFERSEGRNPIQQLLHQAQSRGYLFWFDSDEDTAEVTHLFLVHPDCADMIKSWPFVVLIDSTYKTNKYKFPLVEIMGMTPTNQNFLIGHAIMKDETAPSYYWVLEKLRNYIGPNVHPAAIVSDCEGGLFAPIRELFPESKHLLCTWHINNCVKVKAYNLFNKNLERAERLVNGKWRKILQATTEEAYERELANFRDSYQWCPALVDYVMQQWVPHREKFVKYWTNQVLHFGNTTTCRVESAHRATKDWIDSSTAALDTLFDRLNKSIETQKNGIRNSLEDSRRRHGTMYSHFIFKILHGRVSHYCLGLILTELNRMRDLADEVYARCGCAISVTHGLPCACTIHRVITEERASLHVDQVHSFWRTLVIGEHSICCMGIMLVEAIR